MVRLVAADRDLGVSGAVQRALVHVGAAQEHVLVIEQHHLHRAQGVLVREMAAGEACFARDLTQVLASAVKSTH